MVFANVKAFSILQLDVRQVISVPKKNEKKLILCTKISRFARRTRQRWISLLDKIFLEILLTVFLVYFLFKYFSLLQLEDHLILSLSFLSIAYIPIHGGFSQWNEWTTCTKGCGGGTQSRHRHCDQPTPKHGGKSCDGDLVESRKCNIDACPRKMNNLFVWKWISK